MMHKSHTICRSHNRHPIILQEAAEEAEQFPASLKLGSVDLTPALDDEPPQRQSVTGGLISSGGPKRLVSPANRRKGRYEGRARPLGAPRLFRCNDYPNPDDALSVLRSPRAVQVNIAIMRVFMHLRETLALHKELAQKLAELERKVEGQESCIRTLFDAIRELAATAVKPRREIGFHVKEAGAPYRAQRR